MIVYSKAGEVIESKPSFRKMCEGVSTSVQLSSLLRSMICARVCRRDTTSMDASHPASYCPSVCTPHQHFKYTQAYIESKEKLHKALQRTKVRQLMT